MSPLDDELRAALHGRAQVLAPSPDPLAGIERRARRIQRTRVGAAVAGSVLAVGLVAAVVPALQTSTNAQPDVPRVAASTPPSAPSYALDPRSPWPYRGADLSGLGTGTLETIEREYAIKRRASAATITPLFGQVHQSSQQFELVFLAEVDGTYRWGVAVSPTEAGPEFRWDEGLTDGQEALAAALPGDEVGRLLVVAAPEAGRFFYGSASEEASMAPVADGVAVAALERDPASDYYRVLVDGQEVVKADAPDVPAQEQPAAEGAGTTTDADLHTKQESPALVSATWAARLRR